MSVGEAQAFSLRGQGGKQNLYEKTFVVLLLVAVLIGVASLITLLIDVLRVGAPRLSVDFLTSLPSRFAARAGAQPALWGTLWVISVCTLFSVPVGMGAAIYLEEFARKGRLATLIELNIANLAAVPSIIYGLLGLAVFVRFFAMGRSVLAGGLTLGLLVLPVIVLSGREALRAVPSSIRDGALALGATRWQTVSRQVFPAALPGFLTGIILALSRAIGETAPLITMGALTYVTFVPNSLLDRFTVLPIQIFNWTSRPQSAFAETAAAGIVVLLAVLLAMNAVAILIRSRYQRKP
ncbi:MAG TPA: phosphate ABC transporter permease PstA [Actinomycetota bacterium]|nr:phosphate ABC transporter permease PstA [Actinomycetota bacterium]